MRRMPYWSATSWSFVSQVASLAYAFSSGVMSA